MLEFLDLQLFGDDDPEVDEVLDDEEYEESSEGDGESQLPEDDKDDGADTQEQIDRIINRKFAQWQRKKEREQKKLFGTTDLNQIRDTYTAGRVVAEKAGLKPGEVVNKLSTESSGGSDMNNPTVMSKLERLENLVESQSQQQVIEEQRTKARKEFGKAYDDYEMEIEDMAEEKGLTLEEAATLVLRPKLPEIYGSRAQAKAQKRRKKVDGSDAPPSSNKEEEAIAKLTPKQKEVAKKMGISLKKYVKNLRN